MNKFLAVSSLALTFMAINSLAIKSIKINETMLPYMWWLFMSNFTFLTQEQIFGDNKLEILKTGK